MEQAQKTSEVNTTSQQADKLKEAAELIKADQKRREEEAVICPRTGPKSASENTALNWSSRIAILY